MAGTENYVLAQAAEPDTNAAVTRTGGDKCSGFRRAGRTGGIEPGPASGGGGEKQVGDLRRRPETRPASRHSYNSPTIRLVATVPRRKSVCRWAEACRHEWARSESQGVTISSNEPSARRRNMTAVSA